MEAEYVALSTACRDLFPIMDLVKEIGETMASPFRTSRVSTSAFMETTSAPYSSVSLSRDA
ncbi:hypothetical protein ACHAWF_000238 [Thalassiosira exigua]